jgi:beta-barrel assembly-enhancing protease
MGWNGPMEKHLPELFKREEGNMRAHHQKTTELLLMGVIFLLASGADLPGQTKLKPGFNLFSPDQDVEIGKQSAVEVEKQIPLLNDKGMQEYLSKIGQRLAGVAPGPKFPYQFKVANVSDINAFALPGGFMYVNRGLLEAARTEGELAGVMAHEISHVALRHGTNQASKASLAQLGIGLLGESQGTITQIIGAVGGFGLNTLFLKFSRSAEEQADVLGTQIMTKAGYNPLDMVSMFEMLRSTSAHDPTSVEKFFSDHPAPADRAVRIKKEIGLLDSNPQTAPVADYAHMKSRLQQMPKAKSMADLQKDSPQSSGTSQGSSQPAIASMELPSENYRSYQSRDSLYRLELPDNWQVSEESQGVGLTIVPKGGAVQAQDGSQIICGAIVNLFEPAQAGTAKTDGPFRGRDRLEKSTNALLVNLRQNNPYLQVGADSAKRSLMDGASSLQVLLSGKSPTTGKTEKVDVHTREVPGGGLLYLLFITQDEQPAQISDAQGRILKSLKVKK